MSKRILTNIVVFCLFCATGLTAAQVNRPQGQSNSAPPAKAAVAGTVVLEDRSGRQVAVADGQSRTVGQNGLGELEHVYIAKGYRATFCESTSPRAACRRLAGPNENPPVKLIPPLRGAGTVVAVEKALFGYADLHVHPATHLAWGARGGQGILWGRPGMAHVTGPGAAAVDLTACPNDKHSGFTADPVEHITRIEILKQTEKHNRDHSPHGYPTFSDWPAADSVVHQQMHITMLRRAFEGGLRLMVASATDSQVLDVIWNRSTFKGPPAFRAEFDYNAASRQFDFIRQFVNANASWMAIARTPAEARRAIEQNKLAVVLGLEMDELSVEQILDLKDKYGVALVGPVHLVNNSFGGTAVYNDTFNAANYVLTGSFFSVKSDPRLSFRLGPTKSLQYIPFIGALIPGPGSAAADAAYRATQPGHRNRVGLLDEYGLRRLMKAGLLIDLAHMSATATDETLSLGKTYAYPLVYSHGGLRWGTDTSERGMSPDQYANLAGSGGILGLGTGPDKEVSPIATWLRHYLEVAGTGPVALGTDLNGMAPQIARSELRLEYPVATISDADWTGRSSLLPQFRLGDKPFDIARDGIAHIGMLPDFVAVVRKRAEEAGKVREFDGIFHSAHDFIATWERAERAAQGVDADLPSLPVEKFELELGTGADNLKCGGVQVTAWARNDRMVSLPAMIGRGLEEHSTYKLDLHLAPGTRLRDINKIKFQYLPIKCDPFDTGDTWNIKTLKVTYDIRDSDHQAQGVLIHRRGAPARRLNRGETWTVYLER